MSEPQATPLSFAQTMMQVFKRPGQNASEFLQEFKALSDEDKAWFRQQLVAEGYALKA